MASDTTSRPAPQTGFISTATARSLASAASECGELTTNPANPRHEYRYRNRSGSAGGPSPGPRPTLVLSWRAARMLRRAFLPERIGYPAWERIGMSFALLKAGTEGSVIRNRILTRRRASCPALRSCSIATIGRFWWATLCPTEELASPQLGTGCNAQVSLWEVDKRAAQGQHRGAQPWATRGGIRRRSMVEDWGSPRVIPSTHPGSGSKDYHPAVGSASTAQTGWVHSRASFCAHLGDRVQTVFSRSNGCIGTLVPYSRGGS